MIVCPSCKSSKIRNDYKPAPMVLRVIGIRALLCDHCNRQFRAFSPRSPKTRTPRHVQRKADVFNQSAEIDLTQLKQNQQTNNPSTAQTPRIHLKDLTPVVESQSPVAGEIVAPIRRDLRTEITKLYQQGAKEPPVQRGALVETEAEPSLSVACPECGSNSVKRRQRNSLERAVFSITDHKAFTCRDCNASFYGKLDENAAEPSVIKSSDAALL